MTDRLSNRQREALITGNRTRPLEPDEATDLALLSELLADPSTWVEPRVELEDAVVRAVGGAALAAPVSVTPSTTVARHARRVRRRGVVAAAAAAVAAAVVVVFVALSGGGSGPDFSAELTATALAPGARASAAITRTDAGFRVTLDARGLPRLRPGEYYEAWLKNAADTLVPIGTFSSSNGPITLWSGVSPRDFSTLTVTIEEPDNNQASSGRRVLVGNVGVS
jgi:anti-sigma-K factor RskA